MSHPCQYNVYLRTRGQGRRMLASFAHRVDAINFAAAKSAGEFNSPEMTLTQLDINRKVAFKFRQGRKLSGI